MEPLPDTSTSLSTSRSPYPPPSPPPNTLPTLTPIPALTPTPALARSRYQRQLLVPGLQGLKGQRRLLESRVLIIGLGGLGCPAALYLSGAGVGTLGLMDGDTVEESNLHRQIGHSERSARDHRSKVASLLDRCRESNSQITYIAHEMRASAGSGPESLIHVLRQGRYDLVLDCTDNPATRYLISDCCTVLRLVLVSGAAQRGEGQLVVLNSPPTRSFSSPLAPAASDPTREKGPCYRCVFPRPPPPEMVRGCGEIGILGHVVGTIGILMAGEAVKIISQGRHLPPQPQPQPQLQPRQEPDSNSTSVVNGVNSQQQTNTNTSSEPLSASRPSSPPHTMLLYNTFASDPRQQFRTITLRGRRKDCAACGDDEVLASKGIPRITSDTIEQGRLDYVAFCGGVEQDVRLLNEQNRVDAQRFLDRVREDTQQSQHHPLAIKSRRHRDGSGNHASTSQMMMVVDVREQHEVELGAKVPGSVNIPISKILRSDGAKLFDHLERSLIERETETKKREAEMERDAQVQDAAPTTTTTTTNKEVENITTKGKPRGHVNDETHIVTIPSSITRSLDTGGEGQDEVYHGGGMINRESHISVPGIMSVKRRDEPERQDPTQVDASNTVDTNTNTNTNNDTMTAGPALYFVCQRGNDSQIAAQKFLDYIQSTRLQQPPSHDNGRDHQDLINKVNWSWIGDVKGGFVAMEKLEVDI